MKCHEVDYTIIGDDMQMVEVELDPGETVIAEAGAMNYMDDGIDFEAKMGDGSSPDKSLFGKLLDAGTRKLTGESIFMTHFTNQATGKKRAAFAAPYPGRIVPLDLGKIGGEILCQKDAFLRAALGTNVGIAFNRRLGAGFFGGEGFILQRLRGDGMVFMHAGGTIIERQLNQETLRVDTGCLVSFTPDVRYDIQRAGNLKSMFFGGEGLFLATLTGSRCGSRVCRFPASQIASSRVHRGQVGRPRGRAQYWAGSVVCWMETASESQLGALDYASASLCPGPRDLTERRPINGCRLAQHRCATRSAPAAYFPAETILTDRTIHALGVE